MLMTTSLVAALIASASLLPAGVTESPATISAPPITVTVTASGVSPSLLRNVFEEAEAIWQSSGVSFAWRTADRDLRPCTTDGPPPLPLSLRVTFGDAPGAAKGGQLPLGWIVFDDVTTPEQEIYVSYGNAIRFLKSARGVVGLLDQMTQVQKETLLGRAMGRALAHELGHYLLASKIHTSRGLMKATRTAFEFFTPDRGGFAIEAGQTQVLVARLRNESRTSNQ
jgi:hypothetical protein